ncbi:NEL-type E3 ubiquitin ligase domain-containing protein [Pseudomonas yamanorum]
MQDAPSVASDASLDDNSLVIRQAIAPWLIQAPPHRLDALKEANLELARWTDNVSPLQRKTLKAFNETSFKSQLVADKHLAPIQPLNTFAARLLNEALKSQFNLEVDVEATYLRLYKPLKLGTLGIEVSRYTVMEVSLLQAALHNFEASEAEAGAFDASSGFTQHLDREGAAPGINQTLTVPRFITLCRTLDVGARYQAHIKATLLPADDGALRDAVITSQKDALRAAAYQALLKQDIRSDDFIMILQVIGGERHPTLGGKPVWFACLSLMNHALKGCVAFTPVEKYRYADEFILYIPHDPEHPLKRYDSFDDLRKELNRQLLAPDKQPSETVSEGRTAPTRYQRFLSQFFAEADKPAFFNRFTQPASGSRAIADAVARSPVTHTVLHVAFPTLTTLGLPQELPPPKPSARVPAEKPDVYLSVVSRRGLWATNVDLWVDLFEHGRDKLLGDARTQAVPTADVDARVRAAKIAHWLEGGATVLGLALMFVPVLSELMMAAMAGQLLYETFEGSIEWSEGDRETARQHLLDVAQNLALIALLAGAGKGLQALAAPATPTLVSTLKPVRLPDGTQRLWRPDLAPYRSAVVLPKDAVLDDLGLHSHDQQPLLPLDDQLYALEHEPHSDTYRIQHPTRPDAYAPEITHNGEGAWAHEGEEPLTWDGPLLMRRLGHRTRGLSDAQLEHVRVSNGITPEQLRELHADQQPLPATLADSLARFRINQRIDTFIAQMGSDDPLVYTQAESALSERVIEQQGLSYQPEPLPGSRQPALDKQAIEWRRGVAQAARDSRTSLFDTDYRAHDVTRSPQVQQLKDKLPGLPADVARQLLETASAAEVTAFSEHASLSPNLTGLARECQQQVRMTRAYEGLYLDALESQDSRRLALHTLPTLPGWQADLRVEIRLGNERGPLLDAIGPLSNVPSTVLAVSEDGSFGETNLYGAILAKLTQVQRRALGEVALDAGSLKQRVQKMPLARKTFRPVLLEYPVFRKPLAGHPLLRGGSPLLNLNRLRSTPARVRKLYPGFSEEQVNAFIETHGSDVRDELKRRETQYATFKQELKGWVERSTRNERSQHPLEPNPGARERATADALKSCWRRQTADRSGETNGRRLEISALVKLPNLSADFAHVEELALDQVTFTDSAELFLSHFPNVKRLSLRHVGGPVQRTLTELPQAITAMKDLTHLDLSANAIRLTETSASKLAGLSRMQELTLSENPLGTLPDFSAMPQLHKLRLRQARLDQWPVGLLGMPELRLVDLADNQLSSLPDSLLHPPPEAVEASIQLNRITRLNNNPFTPQANQQMRAYLTRLSQTRSGWRNGGVPGAFEVPMSNTDEMLRIRTLFPGFSEAENEQFVLRTDAVEAELTLLEAQWQTLENHLDAWAAQRFMVDGASNSIRVGDSTQRQQFAQALKLCWQRLTPKALARDGTAIGYELEALGLSVGDLPVLEADFSHVGSIKLQSMRSLYGLDEFLGHFSHTRWLDLSRCDLRSIPPSMSRMNGLTRLHLQGNQLPLTEADARVLESLATLKLIDLSGNPLARTPDFSTLPNLSGVMLRNTGITEWPQGLGPYQTLDVVDLRDNRITTLPASQVNPVPERAASAIRTNNVTFIHGNPLTADAQGQLNEYWLNVASRHPEAEAGRLPGSLRYRAPEPVPAAESPPQSPSADDVPQPAFEHWMNGLSSRQITYRRTLWASIAEQPGSQTFFDILDNLKDSAEYRGGYTDLQSRLWQLLDAAQDEDLREELFNLAGDPRCGDRAALVFSDMEIKMMTWKATRAAGDGEAGPSLMELAKGLFRLDQVEMTASKDIRIREGQIRLSNQSEAEKLEEIRNLEDIEIRLAYRMGLTKRLGLPGQPAAARYTASGGVTQPMLDATAARIERMDNTEPYLRSLLGRDFWQTFIRNRYPESFETLAEPFRVSEQALFEQHLGADLSEAQYQAQAQDLQAQWLIKQAELAESLTRRDWTGSLQPCEGQEVCTIT